MFLWEAANKLVFDINVGKITGHIIEIAATAFCRKKWYQFTNICAMLRVDHSKLISVQYSHHILKEWAYCYFRFFASDN